VLTGVHHFFGGSCTPSYGRSVSVDLGLKGWISVGLQGGVDHGRENFPSEKEL
jgi:hypothetical protein